MFDELIVAATFLSPLAAQLAVGKLAEEGIEALSSSDLTAATWGGISAAVAVQIEVRASDLERAREILAELEAPPKPDWENEAEAGVQVCSLCGEAFPLDKDACPSCQTPRDAIRTGSQWLQRSLPRPPNPSEGIERRDQVSERATSSPTRSLLDAAEEADPELPPQDDLARRACRAALFGCISIVFLFNLYSLWLTLRLCLMPGELTPYGSSRLRWAFALNGVVLVIWVILVESLRLIYFG